jgi:hypothetical protein
MSIRSLRRLAPLLLSFTALGCGEPGSTPGVPGTPDAGATGNQLAVAGSYDTRVTLRPGGTCTGVTVEDALTTVTHAPGATALTLSHAGASYSGTVDLAGSFQTATRTVVVSPATYRITITGQFSPTGLAATVLVEQTAPTACAYSVQWVGTKSGTPNVIPG